MLTVVPDATVLVSAAISRAGNPDRILRVWQAGDLSLVVCPALLDEVLDVLLRARFRRYISEDDAREYVDLLGASADVRDNPSKIERVVPDDPDDDYLIALAREAGVDYVVSGDRHLVGLKSPVPQILTPAQLVTKLQAT